MLGVNLDVLLQGSFIVAPERGARRRFVADDQFLPWHAQFDADVEEFTPLVMPVGRLHHHAATGDAGEEFIELGGGSVPDGLDGRSFAGVLRGTKHPEAAAKLVEFFQSDAAQAAEDSGVPELWLWEDCFLEGGVASAATAARSRVLALREEIRPAVAAAAPMISAAAPAVAAITSPRPVGGAADRACLVHLHETSQKAQFDVHP